MTSENFRTNPMFLRNQFKGDGIFDIPLLKTDEINLEEIELIGYDKLCDNKTEAIVHFFMDDYKFEVMWKDPEPRIERLKEYRAVLTPDFSMYTEMPLSIKVYNTFRSRWCGAYMQDKGIKVIPTVSWGEPNTFWFCFDGIPKGSVVAVSTIGVRKEKSLFMQGYEEMMRKIKPQAVICYGEPFEEMKGKIITVDYAQTNNLKHIPNQSRLFVKNAFGYVCSKKGMGSAGDVNSPTWTPKKPEDKRFMGKPGEIKESVNRKGEKYLTKIGKNGYATAERHCSTHGYDSKHSNPHDHKIDWSNNYPDLGSPINYGNDIPEFKKYGGNLMHNENIIDFSPFESIDDFKLSLIKGREIEFHWNGTDYGVFHEGEGKEAFFICESNKSEQGIYFETVDELLNHIIQGQQLRDFITQAEVWHRNV